MAEKYDPPVTDALMALLAGAAPLFEKAKAAGIFRAWPQPPASATASGASTATSSATPPTDVVDPANKSVEAAQKAALQDIIVAQAMKIHALEAEVARLTAEPR